MKSLDDLSTLAELRDLEDIKEQLDLPAAIAAAEAGLAEAGLAEEPATLDAVVEAPAAADEGTR